MGTILIDTCIFIEIFRGDHKLYKYLKSLDISINTIVYMELIQGARNKTELSKIEKFLEKINIISIDEAISKKATELIKRYGLSHNLLIPDAIIAATSIVNNILLWTFNIKDFQFIEELEIFSNN